VQDTEQHVKPILDVLGPHLQDVLNNQQQTQGQAAAQQTVTNLSQPGGWSAGIAKSLRRRSVQRHHRRDCEPNRSGSASDSRCAANRDTGDNEAIGRWYESIEPSGGEPGSQQFLGRAKWRRAAN